MPLVSSVYGMHSIFRQCHQNSLGYGGGKNINIFKGKVLHPVAKVISVQAAESPGRSQKVLTTPRPLPNSVLGGCAAAQQLSFYNSLSHVVPIPLRCTYIGSSFHLKETMSLTICSWLLLREIMTLKILLN